MPAKAMGDSLLIHEFTYSLFIGLRSGTSNMTGYSHSYHQIKLIHCSAHQRDVLSGVLSGESVSGYVFKGLDAFRSIWDQMHYGMDHLFVHGATSKLEPQGST